MHRFWADLIIDLRTERGWTQRRLANEAAIHRLTLNRIEKGESPGSIDVIEKILAVFEYELEAIHVEAAKKRREQDASPEVQQIKSRSSRLALLRITTLNHL